MADRLKVSGIVTGLLLFSFLLVFSTPGYAETKINSLVVGYESPATSTASVYYQGMAPFNIFRSLDGNDWGTPIATSLSVYEYTDTGLDNYFNYYYKVQDSQGLYAIVAAYPPNNNVHTSLRGDTTYLCGVCHNTHSGQSALLLNQPTVVALCTTCHDGSQSKYDVRNGKVRLSTGYADTSGGPFGPLQTSLPVEIAVYDDARSVSSEAVPTNPTSIHNLGTPAFRAPGGVNESSFGLTCTNCHEIHNVSGNFRNLRPTIKVTDTVSVNINFRAFARSDPSLTGGYGEDIYYDTGSIFFCSACHSDYNQASGSGSTAATITKVPGLALSASAMDKFMHAVNTPLIFRGEYYSSKLPLESGTGVNVVVCLTCHHAHGTFKSGASKISGSTALLRMDQQGVCQECHKK